MAGKNADDVTVIAASLAGGYITGQKKAADVFEAVEGGGRVGGGGVTKGWYVAVLDGHWKVTLVEVYLNACGEVCSCTLLPAALSVPFHAMPMPMQHAPVMPVTHARCPVNFT